MNESAYLFVAVLFAVFLGTVIISNLTALVVAFVINLKAKRVARQ